MFFVVVDTYTKHSINEFDSNARINILTFQCHTQKNGTDLRRSPHESNLGLGRPTNAHFSELCDFVPRGESQPDS